MATFCQLLKNRTIFTTSSGHIAHYALSLLPWLPHYYLGSHFAPMAATVLSRLPWLPHCSFGSLIAPHAVCITVDLTLIVYNSSLPLRRASMVGLRPVRDDPLPDFAPDPRRPTVRWVQEHDEALHAIRVASRYHDYLNDKSEMIALSGTVVVFMLALNLAVWVQVQVHRHVIRMIFVFGLKWLFQ